MTEPPTPEIATDDAPTEGLRPTGVRRLGLFFVAFASGFAVLTIEIAGARLIAPVYGLSAVPWTAVIGTILAALALGSHLGGRWADGDRIPLPAVLAAAGFASVIPLVAGSFPWAARSWLGFIPGAVASALVLFAPAVLCLGAVVPYLVRADTESLGSIGRRAGDISAATTAGSILGSFVTGFFLLPAFPLPVLMGLTGAFLFLLALVAGWILGRPVERGALAAAALAVGALGWMTSGSAADVLIRTQTLHASVQVTEREWSDGRRVRELWQNGGSSSAEYVETGMPAHDYARMSATLLEPLQDRLDRTLVLGGAALSLPVALSIRRPSMEIDVVEIDPVVTRLAREYFAYGEGDYPGITVTHDDARVFLRGTEERWDLIYLDVFDHFLTVPWTMVTVEALDAMRAHLEPDGLLMANVLTPLGGPGSAFLQRLVATAEEVYGEVRIYPTDPDADPGVMQNAILVAAAEVGHLPPVPGALDIPAAGRPLTDAWAPVEFLQGKVFAQGIRWE